MKAIIIFIGLSILFNATNAQILNPVHWAYASKKINKNEAMLYFKATVDAPWHIYSINQKDGGPDKTSFAFTAADGFELDGSVTEPKPITRFEKAFNIDVSYFENSVIFTQKIILKLPHPIIKGRLHYMVCNDQKCLPPADIDFTIPVK